MLSRDLEIDSFILSSYSVSVQVMAWCPQGNCIWNFLDIRAAENARVCPLSASSGANLLAHGPQNGGFRHRQFGLCRRNQLHHLRSVPEKSKCDCPGGTSGFIAKVPRVCEALVELCGLSLRAPLTGASSIGPLNFAMYPERAVELILTPFSSSK